MPKTKKIHFVCTGNTCRSVLAEHLARHMAANRPDLKFSSSGIAANSAFPIPSAVSRLLAEEGIKNFTHTSRPFTAATAREADLILVMERYHKEAILKRYPEAAAKTFLLKEFAGQKGQQEIGLDVSDPIGGPDEVYRQCLSEIKKAIEAAWPKFLEEKTK